MSEFPKVIYGWTRPTGDDVVARTPDELMAMETPDGQIVGVYEKVGEMTFSAGPTLFVAPALAQKPKRGRPKGSRNKASGAAAAQPEVAQ